MENLTELVAASIGSMPIARLLELTVDSASIERTVISMPVRPQFTFDGRACQGGIVATLADFAAVSAAGVGNLADGRFVATTSMQSHNVRPAVGSRLVAVGRLLTPPRRTMVAAADVY